MKIINISLLLLLSNRTDANNDKLPLYLIYSPSHQLLLKNYFLPSMHDDFELHIFKTDQTCPSARFKERGWKRTTTEKVKMIINGIRNEWEKIMIYADVDIQFFAPIGDEIKHLLKKYDLVIQKDSPKGAVCSGFFACRCNEKMITLWSDVLNVMKTNERYSDQAALNYCLLRSGKEYGITWSFLPETYFGGGTFSAARWVPGKELTVPKHPKMHHANWTVGILHKIAQLEMVKNIVLLNRRSTDYATTSSDSSGT